MSTLSHRFLIPIATLIPAAVLAQSADRERRPDNRPAATAPEAQSAPKQSQAPALERIPTATINLAPEPFAMPRLGIEVVETPSVDDDSSTVVTVDRVAEGSPARKLGLRAGDAILGFDHRPVVSAATLARLEKAHAEGLAELIVRRGGQNYRGLAALTPVNEARDTATTPTPTPSRVDSPSRDVGTLTVRMPGGVLSLNSEDGQVELDCSYRDDSGKERRIRTSGPVSELGPTLDRLPVAFRDAARRHLEGKSPAVPPPAVPIPMPRGFVP